MAQANDGKTGSGEGPGHNIKIEVLVITPSGIFPKNEKPRQVAADDQISAVLEKAAKELKLTDTTGWVVSVNERPLNPDLSFAANGLSGTVELDWHKPEGGGGAS